MLPNSSYGCKGPLCLTETPVSRSLFIPVPPPPTCVHHLDSLIC